MRLKVSQIFTISGETTGQGAVGDNFSYRLVPLTGNSPMPTGSAADGYTFTVKGTGSAELAPITFTGQGTFRYELSQVIGVETRGYTYDKRVYALEAQVDNEGGVWLIVKNQAGDKVADISFSNSYYMTTSQTPVPEEPEGTPKTDDPSVPQPIKPPTTVDKPGVIEANTDSDARDQHKSVGTNDNPPAPQSQIGQQTVDLANISRSFASFGSVFSQIVRGGVPLGSFGHEGAWSLISAILSVTGLIFTLYLVLKAIFALKHKTKEEYELEAERMDEKNAKKKMHYTLLSAAFGLLAAIVWLALDWPLYDDMVWVNHWTPVVALVFAAHVVLLVLRKRRRSDTVDLQ